MHYAVIIPVKTQDNALKLLKTVTESGLGAFIEERTDKKVINDGK